MRSHVRYAPAATTGQEARPSTPPPAYGDNPMRRKVEAAAHLYQGCPQQLGLGLLMSVRWPVVECSNSRARREDFLRSVAYSDRFPGQRTHAKSSIFAGSSRPLYIFKSKFMIDGFGSGTASRQCNEDQSI